MLKKILIFVCLPVFNAFMINSCERINPIRTNFQRSKLITNTLEDYNILDKVLDINIENKYLGRVLVERISELLPKVDTIGHKVLHANNEFIDYILNHTHYSDLMKKNIILASIKLSIMGDNFGSQLLHLYYDIVDKCL